MFLSHQHRLAMRLLQSEGLVERPDADDPFSTSSEGGWGRGEGTDDIDHDDHTTYKRSIPKVDDRKGAHRNESSHACQGSRISASI